MSLTMHEKKSVSKEYAKRYKNSRKSLKSKLLDEFLELTGYRRDYASFILRNWGRKVFFSHRVVLVGNLLKKRSYSPRKRKYDNKVYNALELFWNLLNNPCGKRLKPQLSNLVKKGIKFEEVLISEEVKEKLEAISSATIDRLLKPARKRLELKPRSRTKPGTLLKKDIPIRTGTEWEEDRVGFLEIDLVGHEGGNPSGDFCQTLNTVDIKSGWTDFVAIKNKAQVWTLEALKEIKERLPFPLKGIDSDNGGEFINAHIVKFCEDEEVIFTRSRPLRKNDNCYVEEKNFTAVRNYVGYYRYDTNEQRTVMNQLYSYLRLYWNFFQPLMKLKSKIRIGARIVKKYDDAKTPYQRINDMEDIDEATKKNLNTTYEKLNPFDLKRNIDKLQDKLFRMSYLRKKEVV